MRRLVTTAVMVLAVTTLGGCQGQCEGLTSTAQDRKAASNGYEVEKEGSWGSTCELQPDGSWEVDD